MLINIPTTTNVYFPSLNGVRFIASSLVFIHHFFLDRHFKNSKLILSGFLNAAGELGVTLFFVLSGFLITYLLLIESKKNVTVNLRNFYIRRILRIWPLYFLTLLIYLLYAYFSHTLDESFFYTKLILYVLFLPNIAFKIFTNGGFPSQLWSVGSEEQFYVIWPIFIKSFKTKIIYLILGIPIVFFALRLFFFNSVCRLSLHKLGSSLNYLELFKNYIEYFRVDCMAVGGFFAWYLFMKKDYFILSKQAQAILWTILSGFLLSGFNPPILNHPIYSILFGIIILNFASNKHLLFNLDHWSFDFLGKISYGMYVFNPLIIFVCNKALLEEEINTSLSIFIAFIVAFGLNLLVSFISYKYFETPFLRLKNKFSFITSEKND